MERPDRLSRALDELALLAAGAVALIVAALGPSTAMLLHSGHTKLLGSGELAAGWVSLLLEGRWADPASAFTGLERAAMPGPTGFWASLLLLTLVASLLFFAAARRVDAAAARSTLGRRWWGLGGARPRAWARPRDLRALRVCGRPRERMALGMIGRGGRLLAAEEQMHVALLAPTGAGKTSGLVVPWVLEAPGAVISLSVKPDVYEATRHVRAGRGRVWVWDPFGPVCCGWSPLLGCEAWSGALRRAKALADAGDKDGTSQAAVFWKGEGAKLLAPLLHAAATHDLEMGDVLRWLDERDEQRPMGLLQEVIDDAAARASDIRFAPAPPPGQRRAVRGLLRELAERERAARAASAQLEAILSLDPRNSGTTYMSAAALLAAYRYPELQQAESREDFSAEAFLDSDGGRANTLYVVAGAEDQELLAPVIVALLSEVMALAARRANDPAHGAFSPTVRFVGDELANIAPIRSLPRYLSTLRAAGIRFAIVAQNIAQLRSVYGPEDVDTILTNCQAKLFLGPVTCTQTIEYLGRVLGDAPTQTDTRTPAARLGDSATVSEAQTWRPRASPAELQQLGDRRALLLHGTLPAAVVRTVAWWEIGALKRSVAAPATPPAGPRLRSAVTAPLPGAISRDGSRQRG